MKEHGDFQKNNCKTFEIGDGMKSITVSDCYSAELEEDDGTLLLYNPETDNVWIRITVLTVEPKDETENPMFDYNIDQAKERGEKIEIIGDKNYLFEIQESEEEGDRIITYFYDVGYKCNKILISVTTCSDNSETEEFKSVLAEIPQYISSIREISTEEQNFFNLTDDDCGYINGRCAEILEITEEELDDFHESGKTLDTIQEFLDKERFNAEDNAELQSLGIAFGDYIQYKHPDFQWNILHDQYGRDFCLAYGKTTISIFPQTMISKRVEEGQKIDIRSLLEGVLKTVAKIVVSGDYR